ncbi:hypothetical protein J3F84DRAFT_396662 [Trichoderma pleuroticola]
MSTPPTWTIRPPIYHWGTPVVLITTENEDGTFNIAPMSSAWWLGNRCMLGLGADSQSTIKLIRTRQRVINMADDSMVGAVNVLAMTTGSKEYVKNKFSRAGLTPAASNVVRPPRITECPAQMEAGLKGVYDMMGDMDIRGFIALENIRWGGYPNRIDPDKWHPLIMSFTQFCGLKYKKITEPFANAVDDTTTMEKI